MLFSPVKLEPTLVSLLPPYHHLHISVFLSLHISIFGTIVRFHELDRLKKYQQLLN